jgi:hypothetical protein
MLVRYRAPMLRFFHAPSKEFLLRSNQELFETQIPDCEMGVGAIINKTLPRSIGEFSSPVFNHWKMVWRPSSLGQYLKAASCWGLIILTLRLLLGLSSLYLQKYS